MSATAIIAALWPPFRAILIAIGRWIIRRVRKVGAQRIGAYLLERATRFKSAARQRRWNKAGKWLLLHAGKLNARAAAALEKLARGERIPVNSPLEKA